MNVSECLKKWDRLFFYYKQRKVLSAVQKLNNVLEYDFIHAYTLFIDGNVDMNLSKKFGIAYIFAIHNTMIATFTVVKLGDFCMRLYAEAVKTLCYMVDVIARWNNCLQD